MMGGTASQNGYLAPLSKVSKEKPPIKKTSPGPKTFSDYPNYDIATSHRDAQMSQGINVTSSFVFI